MSLRPIILLFVLAASVLTTAAEPIPFPRGFREWATVKSASILPGNPSFATEGGIHHIYANPAALTGYRTGTYADGAIIVYELVETHETNGVVSEGARRRVDMMIRDSRRFASTGGWGFERFMNGNEQERMGEAGGEKCYACHQKQAAKSYVFSVFRE